MPLQSDVYSQLSALKTHDDAAKLFSLLNYEYTAQTVSLKRFPSSLDGRINTLQILAGHEDFKIFHCEVDQLILGVERPIIDNLLKDHPYSLFLFSDANKNAWHFINVKYDEEETRRKLFRRIVIGPDERLHTAAQRIAMLEVHDDKLSPLDLQQKHDTAFDVEVVTKEFFSSFVQMFHLLREEIEELNPRYKTKSAEFSQMLLNRLMFLYFIQKKGWLDGNASYLYERYRKGYKDQQAKHTYYSEILLLVFKKLANTDLQFKQLGSIPFLNGGLFESEPWEDVLKISNGLFGKLFRDLFEHYNFTVREDTAMDMEVAIDPEMLGKVFENLILQLEKDPTTDLRKATGSYYTPRVIVHFMCQQSLKEYLIESCISDSTDQGKNAQTREKIEKLFALNPASQLTNEDISWLKSSFTHDEAERMKNLILNCRVCDPAVGSGAFVVGMLHEMVAIIKLLDMLLMGLGKIQERNYDYELKRKIIEYCLYGVDIQEQAVRICELRLWLSLVVDYQGKDIPPLPNLSYRIRQGDSLIDKLFGYPVNMNISQATERGEMLKQLIDSIQNDKHAYFYESDIQKKRKAELGILAKQCDLASLYLKLRQDIVSSEYEAKYGKGLFGYKELRKAEQEDKETLQKEIKELEKLILFAKNTKDKLLAVGKGKLTETEKTRQLNETFVWKLDFAEIFKERDGFDVVIANPPYGADIDAILPVLQQRYPESIRHYGEIYKIFYELALGHLIRPQGCLMYISSNTFLGQPRYRDLREYLLKNEILILINLGEKVFEAIVPVCLFVAKRSIAHPQLKTYLFADLTELNKFKGGFENLVLEFGERKDIEQRADLSFLAKGFAHIKSTLSLQDVLEIKDGGIQYHRSGIGLKNKGGNDLYERIFAESPRKFKRCIPTWYGRLLDKWVISPSTDEYFNLDYRDQTKGNESVSFSKEAFEITTKFLWRQTADRLIVALDQNKRWFRNTIQCSWIKNEYAGRVNSLFVLGVLNSSYYIWAYDRLVRESGRVFPQVKIKNVKQLPFKIPEQTLQDQIASLVSGIIKTIKWNDVESTQRISEVEREIDKMVFEIFGANENLQGEIMQFINASKAKSRRSTR